MSVTKETPIDTPSWGESQIRFEEVRLISLFAMGEIVTGQTLSSLHPCSLDCNSLRQIVSGELSSPHTLMNLMNVVWDNEPEGWTGMTEALRPS